MPLVRNSGRRRFISAGAGTHDVPRFGATGDCNRYGKWLTTVVIWCRFVTTAYRKRIDNGLTNIDDGGYRT